ncbi:mannose-6-phosphate isomerase, class I [Streptomyces jumonjinensis]|uniref:mannose-6-phosphate isomerase n=1 Tax=Streptomyces jumonjinensis TaxID=1945 RepID=A0A646KD54_STRJU|nr:mannose-6-phosphate isomerase, class I [Streptomyces jumonjinensis]MQT00021.1 mannose-6-phosphate isomerase, class I [Streptomyces jumonjinensis]
MDRLSNIVRPYAWGSTTAIPDLLGAAPTGEPQAEMWMGAHPGAPSRLGRGSLADVIAADPVRELGAATVARFGPHLPFLLKILAAGAPLSLQVHPDLAQAKQGFAAEQRAGIPADAPHRNYKDANHKPELICALTPFEGLCGFRAPLDAAELLAGLGVDSLKPYADLLHAHPEDAALREVLTAVLSADREEMAATVDEAAAAAQRLGGEYTPYAQLAHHFPGDPGVIAAMLLNRVRLQPGEALFLGAGVPHAYLSGLGIEIMANSDNVLRCGLTPKHVDVPELLRVVRFEAGDPGVLRPEASETGEELYDTPIDEFRLSRYLLAPEASPADLTAAAPQILLCTSGSVAASAASAGSGTTSPAETAGTAGTAGPGEPDATTLTPGESVFIPAGENIQVRAAHNKPAALFRATVAI